MSVPFALKNLKPLPYGGASAVHDPVMTALVYDTIKQTAVNACLDDETMQDRFTAAYHDWIQQTTLNKFKGLNSFNIRAYSNGTTEAFDKFYLKNSNRRFRCFRGEYMYHPASWRNYFPNWRFIEDDPLVAGDAVILSTPFSDTGNVHVCADKVITQCNKLKIPVLIDCAFVGICGQIEFDFDQPCITDITFSLSKTFPVANLRIGMRLTRFDDDDSLLVHNKTNYNNRLGAAVGLALIERFTVDYNYQRHYNQQLALCKELDIIPSNTVIFGLGGLHYQVYSRGGNTNRLCFARYLTQGVLPND